ncbi:MAG: cytochrome b [Alphaproteobacteria bacterium]|nr:cytochrome b [Alphaproteobacteria bacterium]
MKYSLPSRILHWLMAAIILFLIGLGIYMTEFLSKEAPNRMEIYGLHKSLGVLVLALIFVRIINRLIYGAPALPATLPTWEKILAHLANAALYFLMIATPLSGYLMSNLSGYPVAFFGRQLPFIAEKNPDLGMFFHHAHTILAYGLLAIITLHIAAVIKHKFFDKPEHDVLNRML